MKLTPLTLLILFPIIVFAQPAKYFNKGLNWLDIHNAFGIVQLADKTYVIAAEVKNNATGIWKPFIVGISQDGEINYAYNTLESSILQGDLRGIELTSQNDFVSVGSVSSDSLTSGYFLLQNNNTNSNYILTTDSLFCRLISCSFDVNSGCMFAGGWKSRPTGNGRDLKITKLSPATGEVLLDTIYNYYFNTQYKLNWIQDIAAAPDGGAYLLATVNYSGDTGDIALIKIDSLGNWQWHQVYDLNPLYWFSRDVAGGLYVDSNGNIIFSCRRAFPDDNTYSYIYKLNQDHSIAWINNENFLEGPGISIVELATGDIVIGGSSFPTSTFTYIDGEIVKLDSSGNTLWKRRYGGNDDDDYFYDLIVQDHDYSGKSGYVLCGRTESGLPPGRADAWLVRLNCMGLLTMPQAAFIAAPFPSMPQTIALVNQSLYTYPDSIDGGHYILDWGDGSPAFTCGQGYEPCTGSLPTHTYQAPGLYSVTLQAVVCNDTSVAVQSVCLGVEPNPQAQFTYADFGGIIQFTNLSQNTYYTQGGYFSWDFGDGSPPVSDENPTHTYTENGTYPVTLTLIVCQDTSVYTQEIAVQTVGISPPLNPPRAIGASPLASEGGSFEVVVYPNPAQNTLHITTPPLFKGGLGGILLQFYTPAGQLALQTQIPAGITTHTFSVAHLPTGIYFYVISGVVSEDTENGNIVVGGDSENGGISGGMVLARGKVWL